MWMPRLIVLPLLAAAAACTSPAPRAAESPASEPARIAQAPADPPAQRLEAVVAQECHKAVTWHGSASIPQTPRTALVREDWVQVDGVVEWRGEAGVARNAWTCDMFRGEDGVWRRRYLSYGPLQG